MGGRPPDDRHLHPHRRAPAQLRRGPSAASGRGRARVQPLLVDRPAGIRGHLPAHDLLHGEERGAPRAGPGAADPRLRDVRRPARRVRPRGRADDATDRRGGEGARALRRGDAAARRRPGRGEAGCGDGRAAGGRAGRPGHDLRLAALAARELRSGLDRVGRAAPLRGPAAEREGLSRGVARDRARAAQALRLPRRPARARPPGRRRSAAMSEASADPPLIGTVAIVGFPNVGKSTLVNRLTETRAAVVHETPGVTRDRKELLCEWAGKRFVLIDTGGVDVVDPSPITRSIAAQAREAVEEADAVVFITDARAGVTPGDEEIAGILRAARKPVLLVDTAGLRRKRKHRQGIEYYSELRALQAAERADVALVLVDSSEGVVEGDLAVADVARKAACSTLVVLSKWDKSEVRIEDVRPQLTRRLRQRPPLIAVSAVTGRGVGRILDEVERLFERHAGRVPTAELNRALRELREARQPPSRNGKRLNLLYGSQVQTRPPRFRLHVNDPRLETRDNGYRVENELGRLFDLKGVPD